MAEAARTDILIAGAGVAGLALATALRQALGGSLSVTLCDPALARPAGRDDRAFAVAAGPRRMLEALGVWDSLAADAQPILDMVITDSRVNDPVRPVFLTFSGEVAPGEAFAHMLRHDALLASLTSAATAAGVDLKAARVTRADPQEEEQEVRLSTGETIAARLVVACDGARSPLREEAGIGVVSWSYRQSGIVATVAFTRNHEGRAEEHFLPGGPFAILPLKGRRASIVWTESTQTAEDLLHLDDADLHEEIERRFGLHLGPITLESRPRAYPLSFAVARRFVGPRLALVGDAAHVVHPIAGQGLNLGLRDVPALVDAVVEAASLGLDPGAPDVLAGYERARRFDTVLMGAATDGLNRLFSNDLTPLRMLRDAGLGVVDRLPGLKRFFIREAAGLSPSQPRLLRGERP
ncbi:ubiquinone biosynthesis hydroxylase [Alsobacter sp. R-9]